MTNVIVQLYNAGMTDFELSTQTTIPRTGIGLYRMQISDSTRGNSEYKYYEVWITEEAMEKVNTNFPQMNLKEKLEELEDYSEEFYNGSFSKRDEYIGVFITDKEMQYVRDPSEFTEYLNKLDKLIQTVISVPESLHSWVKTESLRSKKSLSEIIRLALTQYRQASFICTRCGKKKYGLPFFQDDKRTHCRECFLKAFEE